jgi:myosin heavy subunit
MHWQASAHRKASASVGKRFIEDVNALLHELSSSRSFFIRCIKPNMERAARVFTLPLVLDQLRCSGLMGAVRLMQVTPPHDA